MNLISQILALEGHTEDVEASCTSSTSRTSETRHSSLHCQLILDILHHLRRGGGSQSQNGSVRTKLADVDDFQIGGTEVIAPLGDTICLVDGNEAYLHVA